MTLSPLHENLDPITWIDICRLGTIWHEPSSYRLLGMCYVYLFSLYEYV